MTSTTNLPNPRDVLIESLAQDVEVAHTTHVTAYAINRAKTYGWVPPATSTGQENEPKSLAVCLQASDAFDAILRERLNHAFDAGKTAASQCLHQIQEPPTKTEALAHYSQQAILAMGETAHVVNRQLETKPAFYTAIAEQDGNWIPLPEYAAETDIGVLQRVVKRAREEGWIGDNAMERLKELGWACRPVYFAADPSKAAPAAVAVTALEKVLHAIQHYLPPDGVSARDTLTTIIEVVDPWPLSAKATPGVEPLPLLVRDIARELGITCVEACIALKPLGNFSVNSAVTAEMASKLRECFPEAAPAAVAVPYERVVFEAWAKSRRYILAREEDEPENYEEDNTQEVWKGWQARSALAATPTVTGSVSNASSDATKEAAAPVALPEPVVTASVKRTSASSWNVDFNWHKDALKEEGEHKLYTEQQMRALLAGVSAPEAQAVEPRYTWTGTEADDAMLLLGRMDDSLEPERIAQLEQIVPRLGARINALTAQFAAPQSQADARDEELLKFLQDQCIDLRCFTTSDGEDVGWRTVQHHMGEPRERVVSEVCSDQPRRAIREAMARIERDPYCTGPLHLEDEAAIAAQAAQQGGDKQ